MKTYIYYLGMLILTTLISFLLYIYIISIEIFVDHAIFLFLFLYYGIDDFWAMSPLFKNYFFYFIMQNKKNKIFSYMFISDCFG